jgi:asparagine synthase (glutamine-hydrolysing)
MESRLRHRGPDQAHWHVNRAVSALHTRLAIVDPNGSFQPLVDGTSFTMFNGELFNFSDWAGTEIAAMHEAVQDRGRPFSLFNGYYATIHYDSGRNEVRAYRDPLGVMPMWYSIDHDGHLSLCSEWQQEGEWKELPPCSELRFSIKTKRMKIIRHPFELVFSAVTSGEQSLTRAFHKAVERVVTHTDVGYDLALSGGLDSSMILASIFEQQLPLPQRIITTYFEENEELARASRLVRHYGLTHLFQAVNVPPIDKRFIRDWLPTANPIKDFAFWRHYHVARHAKSKVLLCGEGADEIGLGYPQNRSLTQVQAYWRKISWLKSQRAMTLDRVNLAGMACSVEYRVPFLDHDLVRHALSIDQRGKSMFRSIALNLGLPNEIVDCAKYGTEEQVNRK